MKTSLIPAEMTTEDRWVLWKYVDRAGKPSKIPYQPNGVAAKSNDPATWSSYETVQAVRAKHPDAYSGIGFVLGDGWAGVDLDDVIENGETKPWAEDLILSLNSYSEISPSGSGVKVFVKGEFADAGKNVKLADGSGVEVYCQGRYFTVTGDHYGGTPHAVNDAHDTLHDIRYRFYADGLGRIDDAFEKMKRKVERMPESISGDRGHDRLFNAACEIVRNGFQGEEGLELLRHYNRERGFPPEDEGQVQHKWKDAVAAVTREYAAKGLSMPTAPITPRAPFSLGLVNDSVFAAKDYTQNFLIDGLVVAGEPLILGGPSKTLKTSILVDIAVSLANGVPALGFFEVEEAQPVILVSGESGGATLQKTAVRVRAARGVEACKNLHWGLRLPNLSLREHLDALQRDIERTGAKLVAIDPAYLSLLAGDDGDAAKNVFRMGNVLGGFGEVGKKQGVTLVLVHHFNKQVKQGQTPSLANLSQSGFAEWARQWVLLNHNRPYQRGEVELAVNVGGSAGHGGRYLWKISQGQQVDGGVGWTDWEVQVIDLDGPDFQSVETASAKAVRIVRTKLEKNPSQWWPKSALYNQSPTFPLDNWPAAERWLLENADHEGSGARRRYRARGAAGEAGAVQQQQELILGDCVQG